MLVTWKPIRQHVSPAPLPSKDFGKEWWMTKRTWAAQSISALPEIELSEAGGCLAQTSTASPGWWIRSEAPAPKVTRVAPSKALDALLCASESFIPSLPPGNQTRSTAGKKATGQARNFSARLPPPDPQLFIYSTSRLLTPMPKAMVATMMGVSPDLDRPQHHVKGQGVMCQSELRLFPNMQAKVGSVLK